ncbi:class A beta-lactamase [Flavisphingomonas formosensis]|uniref:class A beta-lactamase n=1 Tax=Flavisphingomonas formosensis TaxID=861534 RepID=UPI0012F75850|nr:class A beta-lactamase [Sphingomonas formosensis]
MDDAPIITRRTLMAGMLAATLPAPALAARKDDRFQILEKIGGGRLGVAVYDGETQRYNGWRGHERFPMCSTFKLLAAALVLHRVDRGVESLDRRVTYGQDSIVAYSPVTEQRIASGMTVGELCEAAITRSDNTAGNLLLASFGGPPALTAFARRLGGGRTRLDRTETELNSALPGDRRDTTTPRDMVDMMRRLFFGRALSAPSRTILLGWLGANQTGARRLRAGLPSGWTIGDKTGTGDNGTANDVAILWPPGRRPMLIAVYLTQAPGASASLDAIIAEVARTATR